jgi:hypothetical protein
MEDSMNIRHATSILCLAALGSACEPLTEPDPGQADPARSALTMAQGSPHTAAAGTYAQTAITSFDVRSAGPNTMIESTQLGSMAGTLSGTFEDELRVVIHANGQFNAQFTITCECTVDGKQGVLEFTATDTGELVAPNVGTFAGRAVILGGTGELSGLRGVLEILGTVDVASGLSTTTYSGNIHFQP